MTPTRTENNKPPRSWAIRKGTMPQDHITRVAEELTKWQLTTTWQAIKTYKAIVEVVQAPKCEPAQKVVKEKGDYKAFADSIKARLADQSSIEFTWNYIKSLFPQVRRASDVVNNLEKSYWLSYRRIENGRNDIYVFFIELTREELIVKISTLNKSVDTWFKNSNKLEEEIIELEEHIKDQKEVIEDLMKSNTSLCKYKNELSMKNTELIEENTKLKENISYLRKWLIAAYILALVSVIITLL